MPTPQAPIMSDDLSRRKLLAATAATSTIALSGCISTPPIDQPNGSIHVPGRINIGDRFQIELSGFKPNTRATLEATATDSRDITYGRYWPLQINDQGRATFSFDDTSQDQSKSTWYGSKLGSPAEGIVDLSSLLQRLKVKSGFPSPQNFVIGDQSVISVTLKARSGYLLRVAAQETLSCVYREPGITRESIDADGLVGTLYRPSTPGPHPGVIVFHGSQAVVLHELSQLLATHGYATVALKYFDGPGLPSYLEDIPLEYFAKAIRWLTGKEQVQSTGIGLVGFSRGVEAALLAGVDYQGPATVIGYSGGGIIAPGVRGIPPREYLDKAAWTRNGTPIVQGNRVRRVFETVQEQVYQHRCNVESVPDSVRSKVPQRMLEQNLIPVEEINGPVLLLTGSGDQQWPSPPLAALAIDRLQRRNHSSPYGLRTFCESGHIFLYPYRDYTGEPTNDVNGGTPAANARAAATSWSLATRFSDVG